MDIQVITPVDDEPVSIQQAFVHVHIEASTQTEMKAHPDYAAIGRMLKTARQWVEEYCRISIGLQTLRLTVAPPGRVATYTSSMFAARPWATIELFRPPVVEVLAVRYYDDSNTLTTLDDGDYFVQQTQVPVLGFSSDYEFPSVYLRRDAVQVDYTTGYQDPDAVPEVFKDAILMGVQLQYDSLTPDDRVRIEEARMNLLTTYRIMRF